MIETLDKSNIGNPIVSEEGQRELLSSNKVSTRCPSSDSIVHNYNEALSILADVLVDAYLSKKYEHTKQTSGYLLPRINKRTG